MSQAKRLTRRQQAMLEDLFTAEMDEQEVLEKHNVSYALYSRWLGDEQFIEQFERRIAQAYRSGRVILARYAAAAAVKLIELTTCEKEETARKACLDIITLHSPTAANEPPAAGAPSEPSDIELAPETASRLLSALAAPSDKAEVNPS